MSSGYTVRGNRFRVMPVLAAMCMAAFGPAYAHIKNEASQFPDIEFSDARFDIVVLVGVGIIPETPVFEPDKPLSKKELAAWAALARELGPGGETPDTDKLAAAALGHHLVDSLQGDATYADVNAALFGGKLAVENPAETPTKAQAARLIAANLDKDAGHALLERRGLHMGEAAEVVAVEAHGDGHHSAYMITIADVTRKMYEHGRVANGPVDLLQWKGRNVRRSVVKGTGAEAVWIYLEAEPLKVAAPAGQADAAAASDAGPANSEQEASSKTVPRSLLYGLVAAVVILGIALFMRRRRS